MLRDDAVAVVARRLGNRTDLDADIVKEMQLVQTELENDGQLNPWFLITENASTTTTIGDERIHVPEGFLREPDDSGTLWIEDGSGGWLELAKAWLDDVRVKWPGSGKPKAFALGGEYFRLGPVPDEEYSVRIIYLKSAQSLSSNIENAWLLHTPELLISSTGMRMAAYLQNKIAYEMFERAYTEARQRLVIEGVRREVGEMEMTMGGA